MSTPTKPVISKTFSPSADGVKAEWWVVDAADLPLGRLASEIAQIIRGKHKPTFAPHVDGGDFVVVINARRVGLSSSKGEKKTYYHHSGYPGGIKAESFQSLLETKPERVIEKAVKGMLPKNRLGRKMFRKLKVYAGASHPHASQKPAPLEFGLRKVGNR